MWLDAGLPAMSRNMSLMNNSAVRACNRQASRSTSVPLLQPLISDVIISSCSRIFLQHANGFTVFVVNSKFDLPIYFLFLYRSVFSNVILVFIVVFHLSNFLVIVPVTLVLCTVLCAAISP